jgi:hypothetical protein
MVTALTLGNGMKNPDPALQPFIPVGPGKLALPAIFILSSDHRRNLLSLQTRVAKQAFDAVSGAFEQVTTERLEKCIDGLMPYKSNVQVPSSPKPEQVDLLLGDPQNDFILVCELRSMIAPGDPREVYDRIKDYAKKLDQAERKREAARRALAHVCSVLGVDPNRNWKLGGIVILDGAAGVPSTKPNSVPIVKNDVFSTILTRTGNLELTHAILCSPVWLPRERTDFQTEDVESKVCGFKFRLGTFTLLGRPYLQQSLPRYVVEAGQNVEELRTALW